MSEELVNHSVDRSREIQTLCICVISLYCVCISRRILQKPIEVQVGGRSVVAKEIEQHVAVLEEDAKFLKLLEVSQFCHI